MHWNPLMHYSVLETDVFIDWYYNHVQNISFIDIFISDLWFFFFFVYIIDMTIQEPEELQADMNRHSISATQSLIWCQKCNFFL